MSEIELSRTKESNNKNVEISYETNTASIVFHELELTPQNPTSPKIEVVVGRNPIEIREGNSYCQNALFIDKETEKMKSIAKEAEEASTLPETERIKKVLEIFKNYIHYAYKEDIDKLAESDSESANWIRENIIKKAENKVPISQVFEKGYGICRHMAPAYLWLAQKAGLKGLIATRAGKGIIKNITRTDNNNKKLFKTDIPGHAWIEIQLGDGRLVPVDPSVEDGLVGDTEESLDMFRKANYMAAADEAYYGEGSNNLSGLKTPINFSPGESTTSFNSWLKLRGDTPYSGEGSLNISLDNMSAWTSLNLNLKEAKKVE